MLRCAVARHSMEKKPGVIANSSDSEPVPGSWCCACWLTGTLDGKRAIVKEIYFTCAFPAMTGQSLCLLM